MTAAPTEAPTEAPTAPAIPECALNGAGTITIERCSADAATLAVDQGATCTSQWDPAFPKSNVQYDSLTVSTPGVSNCTSQSVADVGFVIDASGSVGSDNFQKLLVMMQNITDRLDIGSAGTRVGVLRYSSKSRTKVVIPLGQHNTKAALKTAIENIGYTRGLTYTAYAIDKAHSDLFADARPGVPRVMIVVTDGKSTTDYGRPLSTAAQAVKDAGYTVFAIGVSGAKLSELNLISSDPDQIYSQFVANFQLLDTLTNQLVKMICTTSGGLSGVQTQSIKTTEIGEYTMTYVAASSHDPSVKSVPIRRVINVVDTAGPSWSGFNGTLPDVEIEAGVASNASAAILSVAPVATDRCCVTCPPPVVQFIVTPASSTPNDNLAKFYCGKTASEGSTLANTAAALVTNTQNFDNFGTACGSYKIEWDAVDDAGNHAYVTQNVRVRDTTAPIQSIS